MADTTNGLGDLRGRETAPFFLARVVALTSDGGDEHTTRASISWTADETDRVDGIVCGSGYTNRAVGDQVLVARINGELAIIGATKQQDIADSLQDVVDATVNPVKSALNSRITSVDSYAKAVKDDVDTLWTAAATNNFGSSAPGAGWTLADQIYYRNVGNGMVAFHAVKAGSSTPSKPPQAPKPPVPPSKPDNKYFSPSSKGSVRSNGQKNTSVVMQGSWTSLGNWKGGWFYGSQLSSYLSGYDHNDVDIYVWVKRASGAGGWSRGIAAHMRLTPAGSLPGSYGGLDLTGTLHNEKLSPGETVKWKLFDSWVDALCSGSARGIAISGSGASDYITCDGVSGRLYVKFK